MGRTWMGRLAAGLILAGFGAQLGAVGTMVPWVLNGGASVSADQVLLGDNSAAEARTAFNPCTIDVANNFDLTFSVYFGQNEQPCGGDGLAFILQNCASSALGLDSGEHGYTGICGNSLAIDFDTYQNPAYGDPAYDSLQLRTGGNPSNTNASTCGTGQVSGPCRPPISGTEQLVTDGLYHTVEIRWTAATEALAVAVDGLGVASWTLPSTYVASIFGGNSQVYYGWELPPAAPPILRPFPRPAPIPRWAAHPPRRSAPPPPRSTPRPTSAATRPRRPLCRPPRPRLEDRRRPPVPPRRP